MYTNAQYINNMIGDPIIVKVDINGVTSFVPIDDMNGDYTAIMRLVVAGELVIADAE